MPFRVVLACNLYSNGRALFWSMTLCKHVLDGVSLVLDHIWCSGITSKLTGYIIHLQQQSSTEPTKQFWDIQSQIVTQLRITRALLLVVAFVHPDHDNRAVSLTFGKTLASDRWIITNTNVLYHDYGNSIVGSCWLLIAVHSNTKPGCAALEL